MSWVTCLSPMPAVRKLSRLISKLYEKTSLIITTNLSLAEWAHVFGDAKMTASPTTATSWKPVTTPTGSSRVKRPIKTPDWPPQLEKLDVDRWKLLDDD